MRMLIAAAVLAALLIPGQVVAQGAPPVTFTAPCWPAGLVKLPHGCVPQFGGLDSEGDVWTLFRHEDGRWIVGFSFKDRVCRIGYGPDSGKHLHLPVPTVEKDGEKGL